jgi:hypothetical protein
MPDTTEITPNVVISDPKKRRRLGKALYLLLFVVGIASLVFAFFPELAFGTDIPARAIALATALVTLAGATFGITVTTPNVPKP